MRRLVVVGALVAAWVGFGLANPGAGSQTNLTLVVAAAAEPTPEAVQPAAAAPDSGGVPPSVVINGGSGFALAGSPVEVVAHGMPAGPGVSAFVMACGYSPGWILQCDGVGTVEDDFDGEFAGSIAMPTIVEGETATVDCQSAPPCLIVFLVADDSPEILGGGVAKVIATHLPD